MKKFNLLFVLLFIGTVISVNAQTTIPSPSDYLGYELGTHFTPHNKVFGYFKMVAKKSPLVKYKKYGSTYEDRELGVVFVTSSKNMSNLEQIRRNNIERAGLIDGTPTGNNIAIVWLSYNVHGNEASSSEAAMKTLYELVRPDNQKTKQWLQNTVVVMDPMINPDGRDRYVNWYNHMVSSEPNVHPDAREHHEPWPGGRTNHYYFDLNRDWAWLTQKESKERVALYQKWLPQIHIDFHEQGTNGNYFFPPAASPVHPAITDWQRKFQVVTGKNNASYFNKQGWLYFTREVYDLFYPGYGDTYPIFNGAIGETYEQAGGGRAGLAILIADGDTLTLTDRLMHHFTTSMATVETASNHARELVSHFATYYQKAVQNPSGKYKSFVIHSDSSNRIQTLLRLLNRHRIEYGHVTHSGNYSGFSYKTGKTTDFKVRKGDIVINTDQPKSILAQVLFEPHPELADSITYDITAWALPYVYGLDAYASKKAISATPFNVDDVTYYSPQNIAGSPYAYLVKWKNLVDVKFLSTLLRQDVSVRFATKPFSMNGDDYDSGTLIITQAANQDLENFDDIVQNTANEYQIELKPVQTGWVTSGSNFGSHSVHSVQKPRVALLSGPGTSSERMGEVWFYFDQEINYPVTLIGTDYFNRVDLHPFDVLVLPPSGYFRGGNVFTQETLEKIKKWVKKGGKLIALGSTNRILAGKKGFALKNKAAADTSANKKKAYKERLKTYGERERNRIPSSNPGAIFQVSMDNTHPLAFGYDSTYSSLVLGTSAYAYLKNGWNVGVLKNTTDTEGFVGYKARKKLKDTLVFGVQNMGSGSIVYMIDDPLFRVFWYNGKLLFGNAVFFVGQ